MRFPETFIEDLKRQADIVRVVSDYVQLQKKGANWMACCPFHQEKSPSFAVNPGRESFKCFGCGKGGSVFTFVMEMERVSFPEAIKMVAEKVGVPLPQMEQGERGDEQKKKDDARKREIDDVVKLNGWALEWWETQLDGTTGDARACREYIARRGLTDETRSAFRIGFAPDRWDGLLNHLKSKGATDRQLEASGLVVKKDNGGFYDRFRGRVIFPVLDVRGRAVAFGGRTMSPDGEPKYLNSPETIAYTKGRHLYGLFQANAEIRKRKFAILVEGYLDLVMLYQAGVRNVAASLGTALTDGQGKLLSRFTKKIVINYDGDKAGLNAARRATEVLLNEGFEVKVLVLPDNLDPDDFIRTAGADEYHKRRGAAVSHIQFILEQALRERDLNHPPDKSAAVEEVMPALGVVKNPIQRREFFDAAMDTLRVDASLRAGLWEQIRGNAAARATQRHAANHQQETPHVAHAPRLTIAEQQLLELLVSDAEVRRVILPHIEPTDYAALASARVFEVIHLMHTSDLEFDSSKLVEETANDATAADIVPLLLMSDVGRDADEAADDHIAKAESCLMTLRLMSIDRRIDELRTAERAAERSGDMTRLHEVMNERLDLTKRRANALPREATGGARV